jgi:RNA polymerase sigma-70 factor (ECF subfamily)
MDDATADVESITAFADESDRPDVEHEGKELNQQLAAAVRGLPDTQRHTLILRELQGQSYQEIADATGTRMGTVKSRLARARASVASRVA